MSNLGKHSDSRNSKEPRSIESSFDLEEEIEQVHPLGNISHPAAGHSLNRRNFEFLRNIRQKQRLQD